MTILRKGTVPVQHFGSNYPPPLGTDLGVLHGRTLGDAAGLTTFGVHEETMDAGVKGSLRHWHEREDEFIYVLAGELTVIDGDATHLLRPGDAAAFKAGAAIGHTIRNDGEEPATYLIVGTRLADEVVHYPDVDLLLTRRDGKGSFTHRDGKPYATSR